MQLPIDPATGKIPVAIGDQADVLFRNCKNILVAGGSSIAQILSATIFLADIADWLTMDRVFAANVGNHRPARGMVNVVQLHLGAKVGMQMTAAITP
jgi:2-iminobutanoate/2-iminopropanoate deaminase